MGMGLVLVSTMSGLAAQKQASLSFEEALQTALQNNESVKQAVLQKRRAETEWKAVRTLRLPQVSLSANFVVLSDDITIDMHGVKDAITPLYGALSQYGQFSGVPNPDPNTAAQLPVLPDAVSTQAVRQQLAEGLLAVENAEWDKLIQKSPFGTLSAGATWPLFTGGRISAANEAARIRINEAAEVERHSTGRLMSEVAERYFGLALAREAELVRGEVLEAMAAHLNDATQMYEEGLLARAEWLHAQVMHAQAEREYKKAGRQRRLLNEALANSLADTAAVDYLPLTQLFYSPTLEPLSFFKQRAAEANPQLRQVEAKQNLAAQASRVERSGLLPTIAAFGNYNLASYDLSPNMSDYMVGLTFSWKLFGGTSARHKYRSARLQEEQVLSAFSKASRDVELGLEKMYQELQMALEQLQELAAAESFAAEYQRVRREAFSEGLATSTEVTEASLAVSKVRIERLQAMYQYDLALARLLELAGMPEYFTHYMTHQ